VTPGGRPTESAVSRRVIITAAIGPVPDFAPGVPSGQNEVTATLDDGTGVAVFRYYTSELAFTPGDFDGLTVAQALDLFHQRDIDYLRSP